MELRMNMKFFVKLQKLPSGQLLAHGAEITEAMDAKVQDQNNVDLLSQHQRYQTFCVGVEKANRCREVTSEESRVEIAQ
jgi:hypothetical protein